MRNHLPRMHRLFCALALLAVSAGPALAAGEYRDNPDLLALVDELAGDTPAIIGGDLNTGLADEGDFEKETLFGFARGRGYERHGGPLDQTSTRPSMVNRNPSRAYKLDWFLTRRLDVADSRIVPALAEDGTVLSDHDMIVATIGGLRS